MDSMCPQMYQLDNTQITDDGEDLDVKFKFIKEKNMKVTQTIRSSRRWTRVLLVMMALIMLSILPAWGGDKTKDEETIGNATNVLQAMLSAKDVPADVLAKADCVMVVPNFKKFGFGIGGSGGRGPMSCRTGDDFRGKWSPPAMYSVGGASVGLQVGGSSSDFVLLLMNKKGVDAIMEKKTKLGKDASVAAGPGATAASVGGDVLTYARSKGLFAGVSLGGATVESDNDANQRLYDKAVSAREIVLGKTVHATTAGQAFVSLLNSKLTITTDTTVVGHAPAAASQAAAPQPTAPEATAPSAPQPTAPEATAPAAPQPAAPETTAPVAPQPAAPETGRPAMSPLLWLGLIALLIVVAVIVVRKFRGKK